MLNKKLLALAALSFVPFAANAGQFAATGSGAPGSSTTLTVTFAGDGVTTEAQTDFQFDNTHITVSAPVEATGAICQIVSPTRIRTVSPSGPNNGNLPIPNGPTTICTFTVAIAPGAPEGLVPFTAPAGTTLCFDVDVNAVMPCNIAANSGVTVANTPVPRTLSYNPNAGSTITFDAGMTPGAAAPGEAIDVTAAGTTGSATLSGCAISGAGAGAFSVTPTSLTFNSSTTQSLNLGCNYPTSNASATLTCTETDGNTPAPGAARAWTLSCPAPNVAPTVTSATASPLNLPGGIAGTQSIGTIDLTSAGGSGTGSTAVSCTSTGNVQIAASPGTPNSQGPVAFNVVGTAQPTDIRVGVNLSTNSQSPAGVVTCTVAGQPTITINVNAPAGTTVVPPTFIPSSSTWSTLALLGLLGLFGMLAVGFRRNG